MRRKRKVTFTNIPISLDIQAADTAALVVLSGLKAAGALGLIESTIKVSLPLDTETKALIELLEARGGIGNYYMNYLTDSGQGGLETFKVDTDPEDAITLAILDELKDLVELTQSIQLHVIGGNAEAVKTGIQELETLTLLTASEAAALIAKVNTLELNYLHNEE